MNAKPATTPAEGRGDPFGLVNTRLDSRYEVGEMVAQGGFGVVYRAQHRELRKPVAIKVLKTPGDLTPRQQADFLRRFEEEARTVAHLDHPHVVRVLDSGTSIMPSGARAPWMALEWLEGVTLEADFNARIESGSSGRAPAESLALMYPVIEAVGIAHEEGIVHRDIKPGNLMIVTGRRGDARLKLLDFGIAKVMAPEERRAADRAQTLTQVQAFSPDYAAPEQVSGMRTGPWTDVHALALLMSEMLTARIPFDGGDSMEMCANVLSPRRPTPGRFGVDVGPWEAVFERALALKPSDRFNNAGEFLTALMNNLPPGVDVSDAQLWTSQTGTHRPTPTPGLGARSSSLPPTAAPSEGASAQPAVAAGMHPLHTASLKQVAPTFRPPAMDDLGRAPTLLAAPVPEPPGGAVKPSPVRAPGVLPVFAPVAGAKEVPFTLAGPTDPPPDFAASLGPPHAGAVPTERVARPRSFVAPLLVVIGLCFGALVAFAVVLLLGPAGSPARPVPRPASSTVAPVVPVTAIPPRLPTAAPATAVAEPAVAATDAADAAVVGRSPAPPETAGEDPPRHHGRRHHDRPRRRSRHGHRSTHVPAE